MNCQQFYKHLWDYADHNVPKSLEKTLDKHCLECENCARTYRLTVVENGVLQNKSDIPDLAEDFTARIMNTIYQNHNKAQLASLNNWKHFVKKISAITAPLMVVACLLLIFYFYGIPVNHDNTQIADITAESPPQKQSAGENTSQDIILSAADEIKPVNNTVPSPAVSASASDKTGNFRQDYETSAADSYDYINQTDEPSKPEPSRSNNSVFLPPDFADYPVPVNLSERYTASQTINTDEQELTIIYNIAATGENFSLQILKIDNSSPESPVLPEADVIQDMDLMSQSDINSSSDLPVNDQNINNRGNGIDAGTTDNTTNTAAAGNGTDSSADNPPAAETDTADSEKIPTADEELPEESQSKDNNPAAATVPIKKPSTDDENYEAATDENTSADIDIQDIQWEVTRNQKRYQITVSGSANLPPSQLRQISEEIRKSL
ncbi:MAG: hypothetical protein LBR98_02290 [Syntrophomonadaceae bacterium]|jgi:hypothetical protein|nr:hypothetical protein [Syntrophomonadaceae bacterium]